MKAAGDSRIEQLLGSVAEPACSAPLRDALRERVLSGLESTEPVGRRERRRMAADRAIGRGKLPRAALAKRAVLVPALVLALVVATAAVAFALSAGKYPDSALYPVKIFFESARSELTGSDLARAELHLSYAEKRMHELEFMVSHGISKGYDEWLSEYKKNLREMLRYSLKTEGESAAGIQSRLDELATRHLELLLAFQTQAPFSLSTAIEDARGLRDIIEGSGSAAPEETPGGSGSPVSSPSSPEGTPPAQENNGSIPPAEAYGGPVDYEPFGGGGETGVPGNLPSSGTTPYYDPSGAQSPLWPYNWWQAPPSSPLPPKLGGNLR